MQSLVDEQFVVVEVQISVNLVLIEQVITDEMLIEETGLSQRDLLAVTR